MWYGGTCRYCYRWEQVSLARNFLYSITMDDIKDMNGSPTKFFFDRIRLDFPNGLTLGNSIISPERFAAMCIYLHLNPISSLE